MNVTKKEINRNVEDLPHYENMRNLLVKMIAKRTREEASLFEDILKVLDLSAMGANSMFTDNNVDDVMSEIYSILS